VELEAHSVKPFTHFQTKSAKLQTVMTQWGEIDPYATSSLNRKVRVNIIGNNNRRQTET